MVDTVSPLGGHCHATWWTLSCHVVDNKGGTNLEFHSNLISNRISSKFQIQIKYEYSVASNSIGILNNVEMSCRDAALSHGQVHAGVIVAIRIDLFVYFLT